MSLSAGSRIGPYEIVSPLGAGGMGEVYRARDSRLNRDVAIKVLPPLFAGDGERLDRFQREAQVLASLNHPHIAHIYGVEDHGSARALVMELVEGETLAERIARGPIPLDEAIPIAKQIADALEAAHESGVVHRDLKPANIKVRPDGTVKVLDFGLAKALDPAGTLSGVDAMNSPTLTVRGATAAGVILGTAAYMAPEQARGRAADARADIWAFGAVLYEMLTGKPLFAGATVSDVLAAVLRDGPRWDALPADTPASVRRLLRRCLQKDPQSRIRHAADVRLELLDADETAVAEPPAPKHAKANTAQHILIPVVAALASAVISPIVASYFKVPPRPPLRKWIIPQESADDSWSRENVPAISPDGRYVAYTDGERLRIRELTSLDSRVVPGSGLAGLPTWSPDSRFVAYFVDHKSLWKAATDGGNPTKICDLPPGVVFGLVWKRDRSIVINMAYGPAAGEFFTVSEDGGRPAKVTTTASPAAVFFVRGLPDGSLIYSRAGKGKGYETALERPGQPATLLAIPRHSGVVYSRSGHLLYAGADAPGIWAVPFDLEKGELTGEAFRVADHGIGPSVSDDGTLAYGRTTPGLRQLVWIERDGTVRGAIGQPQENMYLPAISPDGTRVAVTGTENGTTNVWAHDVARAAKSRVTFDQEATDPAWHPKENRIAFRRFWNLFSVPVDGGAEPSAIVRGAEPEYDASWTRDGRYLIFGRFGPQTQSDIWMFEPGAKEPKPVLQSPFGEMDGRVSPDGRLLVYSSDETGSYEVYVRPFPSGDGKVQVSSNGGRMPRWGPNSDEIFFMEGHRLMSAAVRAKPALQAATPQPLFTLEERGAQMPLYDTLDGRRFAVVRTVKQPVNAVAIVQSWLAEFRRK